MTSDDEATLDEVVPPPLAVVFDVGEVLIDETRVWATWAEIIGVSPLTFAAVLGAAIVQGEDWSAVFPHLAPNVDWTTFEQEHERRYGGFRDDDLYADVRPTFEALATQPLTVIIAGNQPARRKAQLEALNLPCDAIATSEDLGHEKPDPEFWTAVASLCGDIPMDRILYVGDRIDNDIEPAIDAGLRTCWLQRGPWGQLHDLPDDLAPDIILEGLGELPQILSEWRRDSEENPTQEHTA